MKKNKKLIRVRVEFNSQSKKDLSGTIFYRDAAGQKQRVRFDDTECARVKAYELARETDDRPAQITEEEEDFIRVQCRKREEVAEGKSSSDFEPLPVIRISVGGIIIP